MLLERFDRAWEEPTAPKIADFLPTQQGGSGESLRHALIVLVMIDLEHRWRESSVDEVCPRFENYASQFPLLEEELPIELICWEYQVRRCWGTTPEHQEYENRFPSIARELKTRLITIDKDELEPTIDYRTIIQDSVVTVRDMADTVDVQRTDDGTPTDDETATDDGTPTNDKTQTAFSSAPKDIGQIGRYQISKVIGRGGFGIVYRAFDSELERDVAIKVPDPASLSRTSKLETYINEARIVARLNHPNIVPVYDVGRNDDYPCFIVTQFIQGHDLASRLRTKPSLTHTESATLIRTIAGALHYAHKQGVFHRDIKPANILLDSDLTPFVADFGLALRDENLGKGSRIMGTPAYMSPEQASGEGHRVDGRSDLFSLGVMLYEMLTKSLPFRGKTNSEILHQVVAFDPRPMRQIDDTIPVELERICLKMLSKRKGERYSTAKDVADELTRFLQLPIPRAAQNQSQETSDVTTSRPKIDESAKVMPQGLRSFTSQDAGFFLRLLPGPVDSEGLPDSIRFWKSRIESTSENPFSVGLLYGPSGCGKSSFVRAGLLPRLSTHVSHVYIEATPRDTESTLSAALRKRFRFDNDLSLSDAIGNLRRQYDSGGDSKVLLVIDQFEQWLHSHPDHRETELLRALRQCDGRTVQCILLVRDDFWLSVSRFFRDLEISIDGENSALSDLFEFDHATKVLAAFGQAHGRLPLDDSKITDAQSRFLSEAVKSLATEGKVISVRLSLFADMLKGKPWTPPTLKNLGGASGVGVSFLEEKFSSSAAPIANRIHQAAARNVLLALMPKSGTDIKGHMQSRDYLAAAAGYEKKPDEFRELMRILDNELRLITPASVDLEGEGESSVVGIELYQLTHDYLVPSLRDWLTRKRQATWRGRAELKLESRTDLWLSSDQERSVLPGFIEYLQIRLLVPKARRSRDQDRLILASTGKYLKSSLIAGLIVIAVIALTWNIASEKTTPLDVLQDVAASPQKRLLSIDQLDFDQSSVLVAAADIAYQESNPEILDHLMSKIESVSISNQSFDQSTVIHLKAAADQVASRNPKIAVGDELDQAQRKAIRVLAHFSDPTQWGQQAARYLYGGCSEPVRGEILQSLSSPNTGNEQEKSAALAGLTELLVDERADSETRLACLRGIHSVGSNKISDPYLRTLFDWCLQNLREDQSELSIASTAVLDDLTVDQFCSVLEPDFHLESFSTYRNLANQSRISAIATEYERRVGAGAPNALEQTAVDREFCDKLALIASCSTTKNRYSDTFGWVNAILRRWHVNPPNLLMRRSIESVVGAYLKMRPQFEHPVAGSEEFEQLVHFAGNRQLADHIRLRSIKSVAASDTKGTRTGPFCFELASSEDNSVSFRSSVIEILASQQSTSEFDVKNAILELTGLEKVGDSAAGQLGKVLDPDEVEMLLAYSPRYITETKAESLADLMQNHPGSLNDITKSLVQHVAGDANEFSSREEGKQFAIIVFKQFVDYDHETRGQNAIAAMASVAKSAREPEARTLAEELLAELSTRFHTDSASTK